jgi:DNA-binding response OmpR family regulator
MNTPCRSHVDLFEEWSVAMPKRILIVEDDFVTRALLQRVLQTADYEVSTCPDGPDALNHFQQHGLPHLVIVDLGLPSMHGFDLCKRIKNMGDVPIIILSGHNDAKTIEQGIRNYAEDYVTKPFDVRVIVARVGRVLSRFPDFSYVDSPVQEVDELLSIDFPNNRIRVGDVFTSLTPTESGLLHVLFNSQGQIVRNEALMGRVWPNEEVFEETLRVHMHRLRRKIKVAAGRNYIYTERGAGYMFCQPKHVEGPVEHDEESV